MQPMSEVPDPFLTLLGEADALGVCDVDGTCC
jgi:hypothetical protein